MDKTFVAEHGSCFFVITNVAILGKVFSKKLDSGKLAIQPAGIEVLSSRLNRSV
jgi:hypothetical protein